MPFHKNLLIEVDLVTLDNLLYFQVISNLPQIRDKRKIFVLSIQGNILSGHGS